jgi:transcriptional regulator with XRE-family HTH domain
VDGASPTLPARNDREDEDAKIRLGTEVRRLRGAAGLKQGRLVARVQLKGVSVDQPAISKLENGKELPPARVVEAIDDVLGAGGKIVEMSERARSSRHVEPSVKEEDTDRRDALKLGGLALAAATAADVSRRIAAAGADPHPLAVDELEARVAGLADRYPTTPHAGLMPDAVELWRGAEAALDRRLTLRVRARVVHAAGQLAYYVGRLAFNTSNDTVAIPFAALAAQHADDVGDPTLVVSVAALRSSVAYWQGRYPAALDYLVDVRQLAPRHLAARVAAYEARTYAAMGNGPAALDACDRMQLTAGDYTRQPGSTPVGEAGAALFRAGVAIRVGDGAEAERWARVSVATYRPGTAEYTPEEAQHALLTLASAVMLRERPDVEEAAEVARQAVRGLASSPSRTVTTKARRVWGTFTPDHRQVPTVAALGAELVRVPLALPAGAS